MFTGKIYGKWMVRTQKEKLEKILAEIEAECLKGKSILDVGSGPGFLGEILQTMNLDCFVVSSDIDVENLRKTKGLKVLASGNSLPFRKKRFDFVFCIDTIHLLDGRNVGREFAQVLKEKGVITASSFCNKYNSEKRMCELNDYFRNFNIEKRFFVKTESEWDAVIVARFK